MAYSQSAGYLDSYDQGFGKTANSTDFHKMLLFRAFSGHEKILSRITKGRL